MFLPNISSQSAAVSGNIKFAPQAIDFGGGWPFGGASASENGVTAGTGGLMGSNSLMLIAVVGLIAWLLLRKG